MHYGVTGFLIAKDILHLMLPDGKTTEVKPTLEFCINPRCGSLLPQRQRPRGGGMRVDSLPGDDGKRGARRSARSLGGAAAGGVVAVFCTADSAAGQ